ncbi:MAG: tRNA-specific adenosine deaminase [Bacteroidetes bacterium GWF2_42_66]|nr:MAG: tRNA-specific adenosine deaminase [Bacteroidetes bacterium GWA2_42_15]OFY02821.1 MAG: tRNA-specific adenosine deaminase [Bacteroidetes bacterium GWE2_42_39]OFY44475.1 MAG: tRNA-specific adenosine deaminase [Bacteroidetes bacterium GWF2_42_66]HBL74980.1 tRNA-specific adenosine deaminase [Prolixibacteraceae bacterium]HCR90081.1 tRNA-specific adenosine deaminase [Prolixibacteraceae bacterium]
MNGKHNFFMRRAIELAGQGMNLHAGGPFGAVIVKDGEIIAEGFNQVTSTNDPTAHAEVIAIREACKKLGSFQLDDCVIYTSCEPCPMCLGAIYWARPQKVFFACNREDAAQIDFDDRFIYNELAVDMKNRRIEFVELLREEAIPVFQEWKNRDDVKKY